MHPTSKKLSVISSIFLSLVFYGLVFSHTAQAQASPSDCNLDAAILDSYFKFWGDLPSGFAINTAPALVDSFQDGNTIVKISMETPLSCVGHRVLLAVWASDLSRNYGSVVGNLILGTQMKSAAVDTWQTYLYWNPSALALSNGRFVFSLRGVYDSSDNLILYASARSNNELVIGAAPPTVSINCNGSMVACTIPSGTAANISWNSTNASSCIVSPNGWSSTSDTRSTGPLASTTTYTVSCTGPGGTVTDVVTVNVVLAYAQSVYYSQAAYYGQATYYAQAAYYGQSAYYAQSAYVQAQQNSGPISFLNPLGTMTIDDLLLRIVSWMYALAAPIVVIMIIYAGLMFIFAKGDQQKVSTAKKILLYAIIGLAIILINIGFRCLIGSVLQIAVSGC